MANFKKKTTAEKEIAVIETLKAANKASAKFEDIPVKNPPSIDPETYVLNHNDGEFAVFVGAIKFNTKSAEATFTQTQDNQIDVWSIVRKHQENNPADYHDHVVNSLRGGKLEEGNPLSKLIPLQTTLEYEKGGVWFYQTTFVAGGTDQITV